MHTSKYPLFVFIVLAILLIPLAFVEATSQAVYNEPVRVLGNATLNSAQTQVTININGNLSAMIQEPNFQCIQEGSGPEPFSTWWQLVGKNTVPNRTAYIISPGPLAGNTITNLTLNPIGIEGSGCFDRGELTYYSGSRVFDVSGLSNGTYSVNLQIEDDLGDVRPGNTSFTINNRRTLSVNSSGASNVSITGSPIAYGGTTNYSHTNVINGTNVSLTAPETSGGANFSGWSGCNSVSGTGNRTCNVTMSENKTVTANYTAPGPQALNLSKQGSTGTGTVTSSPSGINCGSTCSANFTYGANVTLTATPSSGHTFAGWINTDTGVNTCTANGGTVGGTNGTQCQNIPMTQTRNIRAVFNLPDTYNLSVNSNGASGVTITGSPSIYGGTTNYIRSSITSGTNISLTAEQTASNGAGFSSWSGCNSTSGTGGIICNVTMNSNRTVTANYSASTHTLSVNSSGASGVTITGSPSTYSGTTNYTRTNIANGTTLSLTAPATSGGMNFSGWTGCNSVSGTGNRTCNVTMDASKTVTASYSSAPAGVCTISVSSNTPTNWLIGNPTGIWGYSPNYSNLIISGDTWQNGNGGLFNVAGTYSIVPLSNANGWTNPVITPSSSQWCDPTGGNQTRSFTITYQTPPPSSNAVLNVQSSVYDEYFIEGVNILRISGPADFGGVTAYTRSYSTNISGTLRAQSPGPHGGAIWDWVGCDTYGSPDTRYCNISVNTGQTKTIVARYREAPTYTLSVNSNGASGVTINGSPPTYGGLTNYTRSVDYGTSFSLTAPTPAPNGASFSSWSGCDSTSGTGGITCNIWMNANRTATANYAGAVGTINVTSNISTSWNISGPQAYSGSGTQGTYSSAPVGTYTISPASIPGWTYTVTPSSSQNLSGGGSITFNINYTDSNAGGSLSCNPYHQSVNWGQTASFVASGGSGTYSWSGGGVPATGSGPQFSTVWSGPYDGYPTAQRRIVVNDGVNTARCFVSASPAGNDLPIGTHDNTVNETCTTAGWATDPDNRSVPLTVRIYSDEVLVTTVVANQYRGDLDAYNGVGVCPGGNCGFTLSLYGLISNGVTHSIRAAALDINEAGQPTGLEQNLGATPRNITCSAAPDFYLSNTNDISLQSITGTGISSPTTIRITPANNFTSSVSLSVGAASLPGNTEYIFEPTSLSSGQYSSGSTFRVRLNSPVADGIYPITVRGEGGGLTRTVNVNLLVNSGQPRFEEF